MPNTVVKVGNVYRSNSCGDFEVIEMTDMKTAHNDIISKIRFLLTGTELYRTNSCIVHGAIKDPYYPLVYGVACTGIIPEGAYKLREYKIWNDMISRCYNKNNKYYNLYGGIGVAVSNEWLCAENFLNDFPTLPGYNEYVKNPSLYSLDKDYLQQNVPKGQRVYSKDTCILMLASDNSRMMVLENNINNPNKSSKYVGVWKNDNNRYVAEITVKGKKINLGHFSNEIAAANAYNFAANMYSNGNIIIQNDVPYMNPTEYIKYNCGAKIIARVVN